VVSGGGEPICRALQVAPSTHHAAKRRTPLRRAVTVNGLYKVYKAELIRRRGPWCDAAAAARTTAAWVAWWNRQRLHGAVGHVPPAEYERRLGMPPAAA
jgi:transposase InsO family protein